MLIIKSPRHLSIRPHGRDAVDIFLPAIYTDPMFGHGRGRRRGFGARMFRLLGVETRQRIIEILRGGPQPVNEIARRLGITQPATSQHLAVLREAGFVTDRRQGQQVFYALSPPALARYQLGVTAFGAAAPAEFGAEALQHYREFLHRELERTEREIARRTGGKRKS